jgi:hypothetical protein
MDTHERWGRGVSQLPASGGFPDDRDRWVIRPDLAAGVLALLAEIEQSNSMIADMDQ